MKRVCWEAAMLSPLQKEMLRNRFFYFLFDPNAWDVDLLLTVC